MMTSFEFLLATCVYWATINLFCTFNGDLQRQPPEYHGNYLQIQMKTKMFWGLSRLKKFGANHCKIEREVSI